MKAPSKKLKQKHIQDFLQDIDDFAFGQKHKINLEQHRTPPDVAAKLLFHIYQNQPIEEYVVADIGVGTGMLMCGAIFLESSYVLGLEIDQDYINKTAQMLEQKVEGANYDLILADATKFTMRNTPYQFVNLVIMNPPFGTKQAGIDVQFLKLAMKICSGNIYSMHKSSTRKYIQKTSQEEGYTMEVVFQVRFPLKKRFKGYHKKQVAFTEVDIIVLKPSLDKKRKKEKQHFQVQQKKQIYNKQQNSQKKEQKQ